jgi:photosystem II stability/assembly factor-like uncharacterized protein
MRPDSHAEAVLRDELRRELDRHVGPHPTWAGAPAARRAAARRRPPLRLLVVAALIGGGAVVGGLVLTTGSDRRPAVVPSPTTPLTATPRLVLALPTHRDMTGYPAALLTGTLAFDGQCVWIDDPSGGRHLPVWPGGYGLFELGGVLRVKDPANLHSVPIGGQIRVGGGEYHAGPEFDFLRTLMDGDVPVACQTADYWLVSPPETAIASASTPAVPWSDIGSFGMFDADRGWVLVVGGTAEAPSHQLFTTADGGLTWTRLSWRPDQRDLPVFTDPDLGWSIDVTTGADGSDVTVLRRTDNGGRSWEPVVLPDHLGLPEFPVFVDASTGYLMTSVGNLAGEPDPGGSLLKTVDRGRTWTVVADLPAGTSGGLHALGDRDLLAFGSTSRPGGQGRLAFDLLMTSHDGGRSWKATPIEDPYVDVVTLGQGAAIQLVRHDDSGPTDILMTTDGGKNWTLTGSAPWYIGSFAQASASTWYGVLGAADGLGPSFSRTTDAGRTWMPIPSVGLPPDPGFGQLRFVDEMHGWAVVVGGALGGPSGPPGLYATDDGGLSWRPITPGD